MEDKSREDERSLIRCMNMKPDIIDSLTVKAEDFGDDLHRKIFIAMLAVSSTGVEPDYAEVRRYDPSLDGVAVYPMIDGYPPVTNWKTYEQRIIRAAQFRNLRRAGMLIKERAEQGGSISEAFSTAEQTLADSFGTSLETHTSDYVINLLDAEWEELRTGNLPSVIKTGIPKIDRHIGGFLPGQFVVIGAFTNDGKSALKMNFAIEAAKQGKRVGIITLEDSEREYVRRMLSYLSGINTRRLRGEGFLTLSESEIEKLNEARKTLTDYEILFDETPGATIDDLEQLAKKWKRVYDIDILFVDYIQIIGNTRYRESRHNIMDTVTRLTAICRKWGIVLVTSSQINRKGETEPTLSNLSESSKIEHQSDHVFLIKAELADVSGEQMRVPSHIFLAKSRDFAKGLKVPIKFRPDHLHFAQAEETHDEPATEVEVQDYWQQW